MLKTGSHLLPYRRGGKIALYLACGQRREEGRTGFPTHVKTGKSRSVTRDLGVVFFQRCLSSHSTTHNSVGGRESRSSPVFSGFPLSAEMLHLHRQNKTCYLDTIWCQKERGIRMSTHKKEEFIFPVLIHYNSPCVVCFYPALLRVSTSTIYIL